MYLKRYLATGTLTGIATMGVVLCRALPSDTANLLIWPLSLWAIIGASVVVIQLVTDPALARPGAIVLHPPGVLSVVGGALVAANLLGFVYYSDWGFWAGVGLSTIGHAAWIARIGDPARQHRRVVRGVRLAVLALLATPSFGAAIYSATVILLVGDLAWLTAPLAVPALVVAPFLATALKRVVGQSSRETGHTAS